MAGTVETSKRIKQHDLFLAKFGYHIDAEHDSILRINKKQPVSRVVVISVFFGGLLILGLGFWIQDYRLFMLAIIMLLFPLINRGWRYPAAIVIDVSEKFLTLEKGVLFKSYRLFQFGEIDEISVHKIEKKSEVNPFQDGSKENVYIFSLLKEKKPHNIIRFSSKKAIDKNAKIFSNYLNSIVTA